MSNDIDTAAIESLRTFAEQHGEMQFVHLCTAALQGEKWAVEPKLASMKEDEPRYSKMDADAFDATVPFGSNVRAKRDE